MSALFNKSTFIQDCDIVSVAHSRESVSYQNNGAPALSNEPV